ncbi:MAG: hypothetical protein HDR10_11920 [Lachnospiraceae bacterium]|nr:hypothetical protein [Lachnospiraceae bacterium]
MGKELLNEITFSTIDCLKENIRISDEKEIGFSFVFPFDVRGKQIFEFVKLLLREGFYY